MSYINVIIKKLRNQFKDLEGSIWDYSIENQINQDCFLCTPMDFIGKKKGHSQKLCDEMGDVMKSADKFLDITTLTQPTGEFLTTITNAITFLSQKPQSKRPIIRILYSQLLSDITIKPKEPADKFLDEITRNIDQGVQLDIYVTVIEFKNRSKSNLRNAVQGSWNHSKIIAVDGIRVISGGHNLYEDIYLVNNPVFDISIKINGKAAEHAHNYANFLWNCASEKHPIRSKIWPHKYSAARISQTFYNIQTQKPKQQYIRPSFMHNANDNSSKSITGQIPILAIGRQALFMDQKYRRYEITEPSDYALIEAVKLAKKTIKLSGQALKFKIFNLPAGNFWKPFLKELVNAMVVRQVKVYILLSHPKAKAGESEKRYSITKYLDNYSGNSQQSIRDEFKKLIQEKLLLKNKDVLKNLEEVDRIFNIDSFLQKFLVIKTIYLPNISNESADEDLIGNHAKTLLIDDDLFYIGSQNFYQSNLNEFGYLIESQSLAKIYRKIYWDKWFNY